MTMTLNRLQKGVLVGIAICVPYWCVLIWLVMFAVG